MDVARSIMTKLAVPSASTPVVMTRVAIMRIMTMTKADRAQWLLVTSINGNQ